MCKISQKVSKNIQKELELTSKSCLQQKLRDLPSKSHCWSLNLLGTRWRNILQLWFRKIWKYLSILNNIVSHLIPAEANLSYSKISNLFLFLFFFFTLASSWGAFTPKNQGMLYPKSAKNQQLCAAGSNVSKISTGRASPLWEAGICSHTSYCHHFCSRIDKFPVWNLELIIWIWTPGAGSLRIFWPNQNLLIHF